MHHMDNLAKETYIQGSLSFEIRHTDNLAREIYTQGKPLL